LRKWGGEGISGLSNDSRTTKVKIVRPDIRGGGILLSFGRKKTVSKRSPKEI